MPDDHSELFPLLPIPNRTVKRLSADDSAGSRVKVGHRQALTAQEPPISFAGRGFLIYVSTLFLPCVCSDDRKIVDVRLKPVS